MASLLLVCAGLAGCSGDDETQIPVLSVSPLHLDFGLEAQTRTIQVGNTGTAPLTWRTHSQEAWIGLDPESGQVAQGTGPLSVTVSREELQPGRHTGEIVISSDGGTQVVEITMRVPGPELTVSPSVLDFGLEEVERLLEVGNGGTEALEWTSNPQEGWVTTDPASGRLDPEQAEVVRVRVDRAGLVSGEHEALLHVQSNGGDRDVRITCRVAEPRLAIEPASLDFGKALRSLTLVISNAGGGILSWSASFDGQWASAEPEAGETPQASTVTVYVDRSGMAPGLHQGQMEIASNAGNRSVPLTVEAPVWSSRHLRPDGSLSPGPETGLFQKRVAGSHAAWTADPAPRAVQGRDYLLSLRLASDQGARVTASVLRREGTEERTLVSTAFDVHSPSFERYERLLEGPAPETIPAGGEWILRLDAEGPAYVQMGPPTESASFLKLPFVE